MSTITLPNIRVGSDLQVRVRLKDGGVAIDWSTLQNIKACIYSDAQRALAGRCGFSIDEEDSTLLVCTYAANKPQYLGVNRIVISAKYMGETKTYDKPAFNFVRWTDDQAGEQITIEDPDIDVEISVEDVSSSILQEAVDAAFTAADRANDAAAAAEHMVDIHTGPEGKSAYEVAVEEGYTGTEEEWLASLKGDTGETPDISIGTVTTVAPGTPASASMTGTPEEPVLNLSIPQGVVGATPNFTVGTVTTGEPGSSVIVTITGTPEAPVLNLTIPQGMQGNTGSSVAYPFELVNNLTTNDATKGLSAAQGVVLHEEAALPLLLQITKPAFSNTSHYWQIVGAGQLRYSPDIQTSCTPPILCQKGTIILTTRAIRVPTTWAFIAKVSATMEGLEYLVRGTSADTQYYYVVEEECYISISAKNSDIDSVRVIPSQGLNYLLDYIRDRHDNLIRIDDNPLKHIIRDCGYGSVIHHWGIVGDSLSSGEIHISSGGHNTYIDYYEYSWGKRFAEIVGAKSCYNFSNGGQTAKGWIEGTVDGSSDIVHGSDFIGGVGGGGWPLAKTSAYLKQAYIIALGVNDHLESYPTGSISTDIGGYDPDTDTDTNAASFVGYYAGIIQRLRSIQPEAKIFCVTMPNNAFPAEAAAIRDIVDYFHTIYSGDVYLIDLDTFLPIRWSGDYMYNSHGSAQGYEYIAYAVNTYIDWIIRNNANDFKRMPLIPAGNDPSSSPQITVDQTFDPESANPQSGFAVAEAIATKQDTLESGVNVKTINGVSIVGGGNVTISPSGTIAVDSELDATSTNPVQNKVVTAALNGKQRTIDATHKLEYSLIANTPTIPAAQVQSDWNEADQTSKAFILNKPSIPVVPSLSTDLEADKASVNKAATPKEVYDAVNPAVQTSQPQGGFAPGVKYRLGTLTGTVNFALASPTDNNIPNVYWWTFETGSTAPTVNWPTGVVWPDGFTPSVDSGKHYEVRVEDGYISYQVFTVPTV